VFGDSSGAAAVTVTWTRSASARSCVAIWAILSRTACRPSAFLAPLLALGAQLGGALLHRGTLLGAEAAGLGPGVLPRHSRASLLDAQRVGVMRPTVERPDPATPGRFSTPDQIVGPAVGLKWRLPSLPERPLWSCATLADGGAVAESGEPVAVDVKVEELPWRARGQRDLYGLAYRRVLWVRVGGDVPCSFVV